MLIPDNINEFESNGERILYNKFKNDGSTKGMYILHSVFTNHHFHNISGELDFLVLAPNKGFFAIEVKHGKVSRKDGVWYFQNKNGEKTAKRKSPFAQVNGTMNSIRKFVLDKVQNNKKLHERFSKILWGTGIAFTSMEELIDFGTESNAWQILSREGLYLPIGYYIDALSKGSHQKNSNKYWYDVNYSKPTDADCRALYRILRGDFEVDYTPINKILDNDKIIEEFTKEQFHLLDFINFNDRCLIEGAAGTGKTVMAIEILKRSVQKGEQVGLFCYNKKLGEKISKIVEKIPLFNNQIILAGSLHSYLITNCNKTIPTSNDSTLINKFFKEDLPFEFIMQNENIPEKNKLDFLILDETQDLITSDYLEVFNCILKGGLKGGKWVFLGDFSNQAIYLENFEPTFDTFKQSTTYTRFPSLKINCRNTKKIAIQNTLLTGVTMPDFSSLGIDGDTIVNKFPTTNSQARVVEELLQELDEKEIPLTEICLLSPKKFENTILQSSDYITYLINRGLETSTIQAYKGLEKTIIILYDFEELSSVISQRLLYVGVSRAKQKLYMVFRKSLEKEYQELIKQNSLKII